MVGEENRRFFLQDGENRITRDENLINHVTKYYKELFDPGNGNPIDVEQDL
jgi:hypothetical protein